MSTRTSPERYPTVRLGYDPSLVESDLAAMERAHQTVVDDAAAKISALENALALANGRGGDTAPSDEADQVIAEARREAFKLITEARKEAVSVVEEARAEIGQAAPASSQPGNEALLAEEQRLEARIVELQTTLTGLETGLRSLTGMLAAPGSPLPPVAPAAQVIDHEVLPQPIARVGERPLQPTDPGTNGGAELLEPLLTDGRKHSPPPPPPPLEPEPVAALEPGDLSVEIDEPEAMAAPAPDGGNRASFYSRRSAQLPHIGAEAGRSAIAAATDLRNSLGQKA
jgi:hypothetical protein